MNGNAAEHMNLPLNEEQMSSRGSKELGYTEMKGSWFIFDTYRAHEDWCRWRAPFWHGPASWILTATPTITWDSAAAKPSNRSIRPFSPPRRRNRVKYGEHKYFPSRAAQAIRRRPD